MNTLEIRREYLRLKSILRQTEKALTIKSIKSHLSGTKIEATATIKATFDLENNCAIVNTAVISTLDKDLINNWLKLSPQSSNRREEIHLDDFMNLPDWEMSLEKLECRIIS
jgi:hypothetical protein